MYIRGALARPKPTLKMVKTLESIRNIPPTRKTKIIGSTQHKRMNKKVSFKYIRSLIHFIVFSFFSLYFFLLEFISKSFGWLYYFFSIFFLSKTKINNYQCERETQTHRFANSTEKKKKLKAHVFLDLFCFQILFCLKNYKKIRIYIYILIK